MGEPGLRGCGCGEIISRDYEVVGPLLPLLASVSNLNGGSSGLRGRPTVLRTMSPSPASAALGLRAIISLRKRQARSSGASSRRRPTCLRMKVAGSMDGILTLRAARVHPGMPRFWTAVASATRHRFSPRGQAQRGPAGLSAADAASLRSLSSANKAVSRFACHRTRGGLVWTCSGSASGTTFRVTKGEGRKRNFKVENRASPAKTTVVQQSCRGEWMKERAKIILALWLALATLSAAGTVLSFFNWWAACDLGYDRTPEGKRIITAWFYAMLCTCMTGLLFAVLAAKSSGKSRVPSVANPTQKT